MKDSIVDEVKKYRAEYSKRFNYDLDKMYEDIKSKEEAAKKAGRKYAEREPRYFRKEAA